MIQIPNIMAEYSSGVSRRLGSLVAAQGASKSEQGMAVPDGFAQGGDDRDIAIRTMLGEAMGEGPEGMAAVLHVILNRTRDPKWGGSIKDVALQPKQFSAWNEGEGGNGLVSKYGPGTPQYEQAARVYDAVMAGQMADPTGGATHYYAPAGMDGGKAPSWFPSVSGNGTRRIGGHVFAGLSPMANYGGL